MQGNPVSLVEVHHHGFSSFLAQDQVDFFRPGTISVALNLKVDALILFN